MSDNILHLPVAADRIPSPIEKAAKSRRKAAGLPDPKALRSPDELGISELVPRGTSSAEEPQSIENRALIHELAESATRKAMKIDRSLLKQATKIAEGELAGRPELPRTSPRKRDPLAKIVDAIIGTHETPKFHDGEAPQKALRAVDKRLTQLLPNDWIFMAEKPVGVGTRAIEEGQTLVLDSRSNVALRLAHRMNFMSLLYHCLWGDEADEELIRFGYLVRGAVLSFAPTTAFELYLVANVISAQWKVDRLLRLQHSVFSIVAKDGAVGQHGIPQATWSAIRLDDEIARADRLLQSAIRTAKAGRREKW